jgi:hypothetical protein
VRGLGLTVRMRGDGGLKCFGAAILKKVNKSIG